jgi:hypothetical protein
MPTGTTGSGSAGRPLTDQNPGFGGGGYTNPLGGLGWMGTGVNTGTGVVTGARGGGLSTPPQAPPGPPAPPGGGAAPVIPPDVTNIKVEGSPDPNLTSYNQQWQQHLADLKAGRTREAAVFNEGLASDIERQVASMREQAAAAGRPFNEQAARSELARNKNKAKADFALGTQRDTTGALVSGLGIAGAPGSSELENKKLGITSQGMLLNYALGRAGVANDANNAASMRALQAYQAMLQMLTAASGI